MKIGAPAVIEIPRSAPRASLTLKQSFMVVSSKVSSVGRRTAWVFVSFVMSWPRPIVTTDLSIVRVRSVQSISPHRSPHSSPGGPP